MPPELVVPETSRVNRPVEITGTGWAIDTPVALQIVPDDFVINVTSDGSGDFDAADVFTWAPSKEGRYQVRAYDGTDQEDADVVVYSTT